MPTYASLWGGAQPGVQSNDGNPVCLATRIKASVPGRVVGVRFFRDLVDDAAHVGLLWQGSNLALLDATPFHLVAASGSGPDRWHHAYFKKNHLFAANVQFVIGVFFQGGNYYSDAAAVATADKVRGVLTAPQDGTAGSNGLFAYGSLEPIGTFNSTLYGVDVLFLPS